MAGRGVGGVRGREMETTVLEQHLKKCGEKRMEKIALLFETNSKACLYRTSGNEPTLNIVLLL